MNRRQDNYSDGPKYKKGHARNSSSKGLHSTSFDRFGYKEKQKPTNVRVVQRNMVHVIGLPENISISNIASPLYFGKYGDVEKYSIYPILNDKSISSKVYSYAAYITFFNEVGASLAILALDGKTVRNRLIKASYGTTKYCNSLLKNIDCTNSKECLYLHHYQPLNEIQINDHNQKAIYKEQFKQSVQTIKQNIGLIIRRRKEHDCLSEFPSIKDTLTSLVQSKLLDPRVLLDEGFTEALFTPPRTLSSILHRKSASSVSTSFSNPKPEPVPKEQKIQTLNNLIARFIRRKIFYRSRSIISRLVELEGEQDPNNFEKLKEFLCKQLIFQGLFRD